jgi:hypothetical protein
VQVREEGDDERETLEEARQGQVEAEGQLQQVGRGHRGGRDGGWMRGWMRLWKRVRRTEGGIHLVDEDG